MIGTGRRLQHPAHQTLGSAAQALYGAALASKSTAAAPGTRLHAAQRGADAVRRSAGGGAARVQRGRAPRAERGAGVHQRAALAARGGRHGRLHAQLQGAGRLLVCQVVKTC